MPSENRAQLRHTASNPDGPVRSATGRGECLTCGEPVDVDTDRRGALVELIPGTDQPHECPSFDEPPASAEPFETDADPADEAEAPVRVRYLGFTLRWTGTRRQLERFRAECRDRGGAAAIRRAMARNRLVRE